MQKKLLSLHSLYENIFAQTNIRRLKKWSYGRKDLIIIYHKENTLYITNFISGFHIISYTYHISIEGEGLSVVITFIDTDMS